MSLSGSILEDLWFAEDSDDDSTAIAADSLAAKLGQLGRVATFPVVAQHVLSLLSDPNYRVKQVTAAIEEDPALAGGVMRMANSAMFAGYGSAKTISQAFLRLGFKTVRGVVTAVATMDLFKDTDGFGKLIRDHCASVAALVQYLARDYAPQHSEDSFLTGLMHDLGVLLLIDAHEMSYVPEQWTLDVSADDIHMQERAQLGYDHAVLGAHVLAHWKIPDPIPRIVAWHHQPNRAYADAKLARITACLRIADRIDAVLRVDPYHFEEHIDFIAEGVDCSVLGLKAQDLQSRAAMFFTLREDALELFGR